jgi:hypothetical protein
MAGEKVSYKLTATSLDNPLDLDVETERLCVYCASLMDPNFSDPAYPKGVAECSNYGSNSGVVSLDHSCDLWQPNKKVRFWLSRGHMSNNLEGMPRKPWYETFDDGPDGIKGTR